MAVHKMIGWGEKTACGLNIFTNQIEASRDWKDVTCKRCKRRNKRTNRQPD